MRELSPAAKVQLEALIREQDRMARWVWCLRWVSHVYTFLGFGHLQAYKRACARSLEIYEAQAVLLGIR